MHRGITKRISDLNTGDIMREIKLAAPLYREQVFRTNVTRKWIKFFSLALISSQHEREENINAVIYYEKERGARNRDVREFFTRSTLLPPLFFISHCSLYSNLAI